MSIIFAVLNIGVGGSLYILDVYTDVSFTLDIFSQTHRDFRVEFDQCRTENYGSLAHITQKCNFTYQQNFQGQMFLVFEKPKDVECLGLIASGKFCSLRDCNKLKGRFVEKHYWQEMGIVCWAHIILPFAFTFLLFGLYLKNNIIKINRYIILKIPLPFLTKIYLTILQWKTFYNNTDKSNPNFERQKDNLIEELEGHQILTNLSMILEASLESSFQFFFQGIFFLPTIVLACMDVSGANELTNLVDWKVGSIILSFLTFSWTSFNIRQILSSQFFILTSKDINTYLYF